MYLCPQCHLSLEEYFYQDILLYKCSPCKAFWFPESRFGQVKNLGFDGLGDPNMPLEPGTGSRWSDVLLCPQCQINLTKYIYAYSSGIQLHHCKTCKGIWAGQTQLSAISRVLNDYKESLEEAKLKILPLIFKVKENFKEQEVAQLNRLKGARILNKLLSKLGF